MNIKLPDIIVQQDIEIDEIVGIDNETQKEIFEMFGINEPDDEWCIAYCRFIGRKKVLNVDRNIDIPLDDSIFEFLIPDGYERCVKVVYE